MPGTDRISSPKLVWNGNYWLTYGANISTSIDGISWNQITEANSPFTTIFKAVWGDNQWLIYGEITGGVRVYKKGSILTNLVITQNNQLASSNNYSNSIGWDSINKWFYAYGSDISGTATLTILTGNNWATGDQMVSEVGGITGVTIVNSTTYLVYGQLGLFYTNSIKNNPSWQQLTNENAEINDILSFVQNLYTNGSSFIIESLSISDGEKSSYVLGTLSNNSLSAVLYKKFYSPLQNLTWNGLRWLAIVGQNRGSYSVISQDGVTWTQSATPLAVAQTYSIAWQNPYWILALYNDPNANSHRTGGGSGPVIIPRAIFISNDGLIWKEYPSEFDSKLGCTGLFWNGSYWLGYGQRNIESYPYFIGKLSLQETVKSLYLICPPGPVINVPPRLIDFSYILDNKPSLSLSVLKSSLSTNYSRLRLNCFKIANGTKVYTSITSMNLVSGSYKANISLSYTVKLNDVISFDLINLEGQKNGKWYSIGYLKKIQCKIV